MYSVRVRHAFVRAFLQTTQLVEAKTTLTFAERIIIMEVAEARLRTNLATGTNRASLAAATGFSRSTIGTWVAKMIETEWLVETSTGLDVRDWDRQFQLYAEAVPQFCAKIQMIRVTLLSHPAVVKETVPKADLDRLLTLQTLKVFQDVSMTVASQLRLDPVERILCLGVVAARLEHGLEAGPRRTDLAKASGLSVSQVGRRMKLLEKRELVVDTQAGFDMSNWSVVNDMIDTLLDRTFQRISHLLAQKTSQEEHGIPQNGNSGAELAPVVLSVSSIVAITEVARQFVLNSGFPLLL